MKSFYIKPFSIIIISCLGILVYSNTFHYTFHFDDFTYIADNSAIKNIQILQSIWNYYPCRFITFLSLALNYHFNGLNVFSYHLFNIAVHLGSAILVWWLTLLTFSTPAIKKEKIARHANVIALFAGLVFVSHPVQIEAVSYICQRAASMATLFYLTSLCFYVKWRLLQNSALAIEPKQPFKKIATLPTAPHNDTRRKFFYICSLITAIAAMFTKEIAITLPLMILLYESCFFSRRAINGIFINWKSITPFLLTLFIIPVVMLLTKSILFHEIQGITQGPEGISPMHYLLTQFRVMVTYIRLVFLPFNQNLDYDYPIFKSILELPVLTGFLFLITILLFAKHLFSKYRLVSFSILWFFLTLLPESSLLPEKDIIYEHRLYLPLVGFSIFLVSSMYYVIDTYWSSSRTLVVTRHSESKGRRILRHLKILRFAQDDKRLKMMVALTIIVACYAILTYQRNKVWKNEFTLWNDTVQKSPHKGRPYMSRGSEYFQQGDFTKAISDYDKAIELSPDYMIVYIDRAVAYSKQGKLTEAIRDLNKAIEINPHREEPYFNLGNFFADQGNHIQAIQGYTKAIEINPNRAQSYSHRGDSYAKQGNDIQAISDYTRAIEIDPSFAEAYNNRGSVYARQGNYSQAILDYSTSLEINPQFAEAYSNLKNARLMQGNPTKAISEKDYFKLGATSFRQGNFTDAISDFTEAVKINPNFAQAYNDRGLAYYNEGNYSTAIIDYNKAIGLDPDYADAYYNRGLAWDRQANQTQALSDFNKAIKIKPDNGQTYSNRAIIYYRLRKYDKAWEDVHKAQELGAVVNPQLISALKAASGQGVKFK